MNFYFPNELPCSAFLFGSNMRREILFIEVIILTVIMHTELEFSLIILCNVSIGDFVDSFLRSSMKYSSVLRSVRIKFERNECNK